MHESSLARQIVNEVVARAAECGADRVLVVHGELADAEALSVDSLEWHFQAHACGTPAAQATLHLNVRQIQALCRRCNAHYPADHHVMLCPNCGSADADLLEAPTLRLSRIEVA